MKPWKSARPHVHAVNSWLQWGHGDEAVEEVAVPTVANAETTLQWGHGDEAVEESSYNVRSKRITMALQWGHGDEAVEDP